jgi:acyl-CoA synthetase (AMP-forming)/AMP-acid ligase II
VVDSDGAQQLSWGDLVRSGERAAKGFRDCGVGPGDRVGLVLTNSIDAIVALAGVWFAGATAVSLPLIARGMALDGYQTQLARLCEHARVPLLVCDEDLCRIVAPNDALEVASFEAIARTGVSADLVPPADDAIAFVQFSSGATGEPCGAALTARAIEAQLKALADAVAVDPRTDRVSAWLPLSHDMGLFGCLLLSWYTGTSLLLGTPQRFLSSPRTWLADCAGVGATLTAIQPSALRLASRAERRASEDRLSLRACLVGGERIPAGVLEDASTLLTARGVARTALTPAYGLAEATLAVSVAPVGESPRLHAVDGEALWQGQVVDDPDPKRAVRVVSCGPPLRGTLIAIDGHEPVGELFVRSPSLATGYLDDDAATKTKFVDGTLATGDLGFVRDGEVYPLARTDDVLNVAGRRVNLLEIEEELSSHTAVRSGRLAIVDVADDDRVRHVALAELTATAAADLPSLAQELRRAALSAGGVPLDECVFVERGQFPKTASGKVQRFRARELAVRANAHERVILRG